MNTDNVKMLNIILYTSSYVIFLHTMDKFPLPYILSYSRAMCCIARSRLVGQAKHRVACLQNVAITHPTNTTYIMTDGKRKKPSSGETDQIKFILFRF